MPPIADIARSAPEQDRRSIAFLNWAHGIDHFVLGIYPTVVIGLEVVFNRPYSELIAISTGMFVAFGVCSLPAGWLADRWSRRSMMVAFFIGCGVALILAAVAPDPVTLAIALFLLGVFAAIYHPVGMAMLIEASQARGRTLAFNGVCGNVGVAVAAAITAALASVFGWRGAFLVPAVVCIATGVLYMLLIADDRHRTGSRNATAVVALSRRAALALFLVYVVISFSSGLVFNTLLIALPKIVDEKLGASVSLIEVGSVATGIFLCGAFSQLAIGRLVERFPAYRLFGVVAMLQFAGLLWAAQTNGAALLAALVVTTSAIYAQVTLGDVVIARYTADAWRGRIYAVRFFLVFVTSAVAVSGIALLHERAGFDLVLAAIAGVAGVMAAAVMAFVALVSGIEARQRAMPAE